MNVHESEKLMSKLSTVGFEKANSKETADIIIFNTCCIRNTAEQKIISHIGETKNSGKIIAIIGCLSQRENSADSIKKKFPHIAIILGTHNAGELADKLRQYVDNQKKLTEIRYERTVVDTPALIGACEDTAFINITYGCENYCSYCIVPYVRGKLISRDSDLIKQEFRERLKSNPSIVMLLGQNVNSYICPKNNITFPLLLESLCHEIPAASKTLINFMSSHPKDFSDHLAKVIADNPQIERNIHLPLQSGCDRILALMNRGYTVAEYEAKIVHLRKLVPNIRITTDIICGFPSETQEDFQLTIETIKRIRFNAAFIFPYSRRTGTAADKMPDQIDAKTKNERATTLIKIQREISKTIFH